MVVFDFGFGCDLDVSDGANAVTRRCVDVRLGRLRADDDPGRTPERELGRFETRVEAAADRTGQTGNKVVSRLTNADDQIADNTDRRERHADFRLDVVLRRQIARFDRNGLRLIGDRPDEIDVGARLQFRVIDGNAAVRAVGNPDKSFGVDLVFLIGTNRHVAQIVRIVADRDRFGLNVGRCRRIEDPDGQSGKELARAHRIGRGGQFGGENGVGGDRQIALGRQRSSHIDFGRAVGQANDHGRSGNRKQDRRRIVGVLHECIEERQERGRRTDNNFRIGNRLQSQITMRVQYGRLTDRHVGRSLQIPVGDVEVNHRRGPQEFQRKVFGRLETARIVQLVFGRGRDRQIARRVDRTVDSDVGRDGSKMVVAVRLVTQRLPVKFAVARSGGDLHVSTRLDRTVDRNLGDRIVLLAVRIRFRIADSRQNNVARIVDTADKRTVGHFRRRDQLAVGVRDIDQIFEIGDGGGDTSRIGDMNVGGRQRNGITRVDTALDRDLCVSIERHFASAHARKIRFGRYAQHVGRPIFGRSDDKQTARIDHAGRTDGHPLRGYEE